MLFIRTVAALLLITGTWWCMADAAWSSDFIRANLATVLTTPPPTPPKSTDGLDLVEDGQLSSCCVDFDRARGIAFATMLLGGAPMAGFAVILARRLRGREVPVVAEPFLLAALVFQFASMVLASLLILLFLPDAFGGHFRDGIWFMAFLLPTSIGSGVAVRIWHRLRMQINYADAALVPVRLRER